MQRRLSSIGNPRGSLKSRYHGTQSKRLAALLAKMLSDCIDNCLLRSCYAHQEIGQLLVSDCHSRLLCRPSDAHRAFGKYCIKPILIGHVFVDLTDSQRRPVCEGGPQNERAVRKISKFSRPFGIYGGGRSS